MNNMQWEFPVTIYGEIQTFTPTISKARARIFYKYRNRNGTYITDEFADKLLSTIAYAPVKGIYSAFDEDFEDHGEKRSEGRIYGIVPYEPNSAWEDHKDKDGIVRTYACVDVYLYTALYKEAMEIVTKGQSMELYDKSIAGDWQIIDGERVFVFSDGCFLGLQALGDNVEPCFEGSAFFSLYENIEKLIEEYNLKMQGGKSEMEKLNFKLSDSQKHDGIWMLLNPNYCEAGNWEVSYSICDIYDNYAVAFNYETGKYERIYYTKDDTTDSLVINSKEQCFIMDITQEEKTALEALHALHNNTYEKVDETFTKITNDNEMLVQKIVEKDETISTLQTERDSINSDLEMTKNTLVSLQEETIALKNYKMDVENAQKQSIIASYSNKLDEEVIVQFTNNIDKYSIEDLDKELAYTFVKATNFNNQEKENGYIPKDVPVSGLEQILLKWRDK